MRAAVVGLRDEGVREGVEDAARDALLGHAMIMRVLASEDGIRKVPKNSPVASWRSCNGGAGRKPFQAGRRRYASRGDGVGGGPGDGGMLQGSVSRAGRGGPSAFGVSGEEGGRVEEAACRGWVDCEQGWRTWSALASGGGAGGRRGGAAGAGAWRRNCGGEGSPGGGRAADGLGELRGWSGRWRKMPPQGRERRRQQDDRSHGAFRDPASLV